MLCNSFPSERKKEIVFLNISYPWNATFFSTSIHSDKYQFILLHKKWRKTCFIVNINYKQNNLPTLILLLNQCDRKTIWTKLPWPITASFTFYEKALFFSLDLPGRKLSPLNFSQGAARRNLFILFFLKVGFFIGWLATTSYIL